MAETDFKYDAFISYSHKDEEWVVGILLPRLETTGIKACIDFRDFEAGIASLVNMENAVELSRHTIAVLTPNWIESEWADFEGLLTGTSDPSGRRKKLIPIMLNACNLPKRISMLTYVDFTRKDRENIAWGQLLKACGAKTELVKINRNEILPEEQKTNVQLILEGDYSDFDEESQQDLVVFLAGTLRVDIDNIHVLHVMRGSIVIDLEMPVKAAYLLIKMALEKDIQLRTKGILSIQVERQEAISLVANTQNWFLAHPYPMPPNFTGRVRERMMLTQWLNGDKEDPLLILRALGGFGKSALSWHWLTHDIDSQRWLKVVWWSFYEGDASFEHFIEETLKYLKLQTPQGQRAQVDALLKAMQSQKILLVMDGFERALRAYSSMSAAYQGDDEPKMEDNQLDCVNINAEIFLKSICSLPNIESKILMTTRLTPRAVKLRGGFMLGCREEELAAMQKEDAIEFFKKQKINGTHADIEAACAPYGYHPLSLRLLAGCILKDFENPADIVVAKRLKIDGDIKQHQHHVLEVSYNSLPSQEQKLLSTIACFRSPVDYKVLDAIVKNKDSLDNILHNLVERGLLHFDEKNREFDLHPIVRRYAYERLTAPDRIAAHSSLRNYFSTVNVPTSPQTLDDITPIIELYHHTVKAGLFDEAMDTYYRKLWKTVFYRLCAYDTEIELLLALFPNQENLIPLLMNKSAQAWTFSELANAYSLSGQPRRAVVLNEKYILISQKLKDKENEARGYENMATQQLVIGDLRVAETNLQRSINISKEHQKQFDEACGRYELGLLLSYRGVWEKAKQELDNSYMLFSKEEIQPQSLLMAYHAQRFLLMNRGSLHTSANTKSAIQLAQRALDLAEETAHEQQPYPADFTRAHWLLGAACRLNNQLDLAENHLNEALARDRTINLVELEANILLDFARLRYDQKNYEEAKSLAEEALTITERCGYVLQGADVNLFFAQYALEQEKDKSKAKKYAETALKLATCDGPPYYYKVAYEEAERMLESLK